MEPVIDQRVKKIFTLIILLFMPLSTYVTVIEGITFGDVALMGGFIMIVLYSIRHNLNFKKIFSMPIAVLLGFIILQSLLVIYFTFYQDQYSLLAVIRYSFYLLVILFGAKNFFDLKSCYKLYRNLAVLFASYAILQFAAFYLFKIVLPVNILGLPTPDYINNLTSDRFYQYYVEGSVLFRPYSIFLEPAYYVVYEAPILYLLLNNIKQSKQNYIAVFLITIGIIISGSTTGLILLFLCWIPTFFRNHKKITKRMLLFLALGFFGLILFINTSFFQGVWNRIITSDGEAGNAVMGRFENFSLLFGSDVTLVKLLFGQGMWIEEFYLPSIGRIISSFGLIGLLGYFIFLIATFIKSNKIGRFFVIFLIILCFGTNTFFNISSVLILTLIFNNHIDCKWGERNDL